MKMKTKMTFLAIVFMLIQAPFVIADNIVINNNPAPPQSNEPPPPPPPAQQGGGCPPANQNNIYDPRCHLQAFIILQMQILIRQARKSLIS